ncbi:MAG: HDIG domain-containing metalloprotein, partial [Verrucomicrobiota bacterium]
DILTTQERERLLNDVPHVYSIDMEPYEIFKTNVEKLVAEIERYAEIEPDLSANGAKNLVNHIASEFNSSGGYRLSVSDLTSIVEFADIKTQKDIIETGLISLQESYRLGIYDPADPRFRFADDTVALFNIIDQEGSIGKNSLESIEVALRSLRIALTAANVPKSVAEAFIHLFDDGLEPNLVRNHAAEIELSEQLLADFKPVIAAVERGASLIEPGTTVTEEQYERLVEYRKHLDGKSDSGLDDQLLGRMLLILGMVVAATLYIRLEDRETLQSNGRLALLAVVVIINLAIVRVCFELSNLERFVYDSELSAILPYITPTALAPILVAILMGTGPGLLTAFIVSLVTAVMFGNRLDILVMAFMASTIAIFICRNIRKRGRVVLGGTIAGASVAAFTALFNYSDGIPTDTLFMQAAGGLLTGVTEGIVVLGILPVLEGLFKRTTDITLLELSDYNHPLLRRMQLEAPGTWHHSLMVANLAENACNAIGANGLMARVSCMYHDIGKMVKPEYFTENQLDGHNPHNEKTPSFSALIIKSHVKEGVDLGLTYKLPRPIIDIIRQHHGTNLIRFFYHKACQQAEAEGAGNIVQESTYRYDGPKPQFKESAVILLADSIEAASRSLAKVTPQNVEELIDRIFSVNIKDGQLDECPINMAELAKIRESFIFTILNSLHSRIAYPSDKQTPPALKKAKEQREYKEPKEKLAQEAKSSTPEKVEANAS